MTRRSAPRCTPTSIGSEHLDDRALRRCGALLGELDPKHPSRSTLEVLTRRLLVAHGITEFTREFPLAWMGRSSLFDFAFERQRTILETNGDGGTTIPPTTRRPREVERPGPPRLPRRVRDLGQGHASRARVPRRTRRNSGAASGRLT